jgi:exopolysaccharide production protein ExoZ
VLTGFLIFRSVQKIDSWDRFTQYASNRTYRILPLYVFAVGSIALLSAFGFSNATSAEPFHFIFAPLPLQGIIEPMSYNVVLGQLWSLYVEIEFYMLAPFIVLLSASLAKKGTGAVLGVLFVTIIWFLFIKEYGGREAQLWVFFFFGILASVIIDTYGGKIPPLIGTGLIVVGVCLIGGYWLSLGWISETYGQHATQRLLGVLIGVGTTMVVIGSIVDKWGSRILSFRPMRILGTVSYSMFILHTLYLYANFYPIGILPGSLTPEKISADTQSFSLLYFSLVFVSSMIFVAMIGYALIERPFLNLRKPTKRPLPAATRSPTHL